MKLKTNKRIIGVLILLVIAIVYTNTYAVNCNQDGYQDYDTVGRYGIKLDYVSSYSNGSTNLYTFSLSMNSGVCDTSFGVLVDKITGADYSVGTLSCGAPLSITVPESDLEYKNLALPSLNIYLKSNDSITDGQCTLDFVEADLSSTPVLPASYQNLTNPIGTITPITVEGGNKINCATGGYSATSFEGKFCNAKTKAGTNDSSPSSEHTFKCSTTITDDMLDPTKLEGDDYYINKNYLYHSEDKTEVGAAYEYHYDTCGTLTTGDSPSCTITCEESVEVEYGPPVASKAGMCFEYKVRVTSRTNCYMKSHTEPPSPNYSCCSPTPKCTSSNGKTYKQGGPSEDFDACVKKCDGGKYSKSCSNKCYKQVYGSAISGAKMNNSFLEDVVATKMDISISSSDIFCYSDGGITWSSGDGSGTASWYGSHSWGSSPHDRYIDDPYGNGIPRFNKGNGNFCQDECHWEGCSGTYLCPATNAAKDYEENLKKYNDLISKCNGLAVCSTQTAYVTISADYSTNKNPEIKTITFPSSGKNSVTPTASGGVSLPGDGEESIILKDDPRPGEGILGCYNSSDPATNLYRLTWSFPGTWINSKSGEITYVPQGECTNGICKWQEQKNKFCVPNNAANVNEDWWNTYYSKLITKNGIDTSIDEAEVQSKCLTTRVGTILQPNTTSGNIKYNIKAKTENFGYFKWNIEMQCFYALNSTPLSPPETNTEDVPEECKSEPDNYRVRSVDLENLFPSKDGSKLNNSETYGRLPGHNWTNYSDPSNNAAFNNPDYFNSTATPINYLKKIQGAKDTIYDSDNFEYEIYLSPSDIRSVRKESRAGSAGGNYTEFNESNFKVDANGVIRYYSDIISRFDVHPEESARSCNNIDGHSGNCE